MILLRLGAGGLIGVIFSAIGGISLLVAAGLAADLWSDRKHRVHVTGTVVANTKRCHKGCSYRPVVEYPAAGGRYAVTGTVGNSDPVFAVGETVTVLVDPNDPREARIDHWTESGFGILFGGFFFLVFGGIGGFSLYAWRREQSRNRWAQSQGTPVQATLIGVERDRRVKLNGRSPFRIAAQWQNPRDGQTYTFHSESMWADPARALAGRTQIAVRLDPDNPKRYWMDTRFLLPQGP